MKQCNECEAFRCKRMMSKWPDIRMDHQMSVHQMRTKCPSYVPPKEYAQPMMIHLSNDPRKTGSVTELLTAFDLIIEEKPHYPYFEFYTKKRGGRVKQHRKKRNKRKRVVGVPGREKHAQDNRRGVRPQKRKGKTRVYEVPKKQGEDK